MPSQIPTRRRSFVRLSLVAVLGCTACFPLVGQTLYWDTNGTTAGSSNAGGAWTGNFWSTDSAGGATPGAWVSGRDAVFSAGTNATGSYTVTVSGTQNVSSINVEEGGVTFSGGTLNFNDATPDFTVASGLTTNVSSLITGTNGLNKQGAGTLALQGTGFNYSGATIVNAGVLDTSSAKLYNSGAGTGSITVNNGGTLIAGTDFLGAFNTNSNVAVTINQGGMLRNQSGSTVTLNNATLNGGTIQTAQGSSAFYQAVQLKGTVTVGGTSVSTIGGNVPPLTNDKLQIGNNTNGGVTTFDVANVNGTSAPDLLVTTMVMNGTLASGSNRATSGLTKTGDGTMLLQWDSQYTGNTTVLAGTLTLQGYTQSPSFDISSGAVLELNYASDRNSGSNIAFTGAGTLRKTGGGTALWSTSAGTFAMASGSLIDVQGGVFRAGAGGNELWTNNLSDLNVAAGAIFQGVEANVRVDAITGSGTIRSGFAGAGYQNFTFGVDNGSGTFSGTLIDEPGGGAPGNYVKAGTGTQIFTGASTYTGTTTVNGGVLSVSTIGNGGVAGGLGQATNASDRIVINGGTIQYTGAAASTDRRFTLGVNGGGIDASGSGAITWADTGTIALSGTNTSRTLTLTGTNTGDNTLASVLGNNGSGATSLNKEGAGTWVLSNSNTYTGGTTVSNGTLYVTNTTGSATGAGTVTVAAGATLGGTGRISGAVNLNSANSHLSPGALGTGVLTLGATTLGNTTQLDYGLGTVSDKTVVNGALTLDGALNITNTGGFGAASSYRLFDYTGALTDNTLSMGLVVMGYDYAVSTATANQVNLVLTATGKAYWDGTNPASNGTVDGGGGTWNNTSTNWTTSTGNGNGVWMDNLTPVFNTVGGTVTLAQPVSVHGMEFGVGGYTLTNSTITLSDSTAITTATGVTSIASLLTGSNGLTKAGNGTLALSNANTYTGVTTINAGMLSVATINNGGVAGGLGQASNAAANIVINGGTLQYTGAAASTDRRFTLGVNGGSIDASGSGAINWTDTGTIALSGTNTPRTLTLTGTNTGDNTLAGILGNNGSGATSLVKNGSGTWVLSNNNTYTGGTTVNAGTLKLTTAPSSPTTGVIRGALTINAGATVDANTADAFGYTAGSQVDTVVINSGTLNNTSNGNLGWGIDYTLNNGATMNSNGGVDSNTSTSLFAFGGDAGDTTTVAVTGTGTSLISGRINMRGNNGNPGTTFNVAGGSALNVTAGITSSAGTTGLTKSGDGTMTLSGGVANTYTGPTTVNNGTLVLDKTPGVNAVGASNTLIIGDNIGAAASATVALQQSNQISNTTDVTINSDGRLSMGTASDTISQLAGTGLLDVGSSGNLILGTDNSSSVFNGTITGSGALTKSGTGSLTFTQDINYDGSLNLNGGTLVLNNMDLSVANLNITANSVIDFDATGDSHLFVGTLNLSAGTLLNIVNWTKGVDAFYAEFWPGATHDLVNNGNTAPMNQIVFNGWTASDTGWDSADNQIYPSVPEPSTYGAIFLGLSVALVGYRRWQKRAPMRSEFIPGAQAS